MKIIKCDVCKKVTNDQYIPASIVLDRGSNIIIGGGMNELEWDLCEKHFQLILNFITKLQVDEDNKNKDN